MVCYAPGTGFCALIIGAVLWRLHTVIAEIFHWTWIVAGWFAVAAAATTAAIVATLAVAFVAWTAHLIRDRQAQRGACLTCKHPCQQAQVSPAPVALPFPRPRPVRSDVEVGTHV